jgi:hypothetical protein
LSVIGSIGAAVYIVGIHKLGQFTLVQHVVRIWKTPEMDELRHGIATKLSNTSSDAMQNIRVKLATTRDGEATRPARAPDVQTLAPTAEP